MLIITAVFIGLAIPYKGIANGGVNICHFALVDGELQGDHTVASMDSLQCSFIVVAFGEELVVPSEGVAGGYRVIYCVGGINGGHHSRSGTFAIGLIVTLAYIEACVAHVQIRRTVAVTTADGAGGVFGSIPVASVAAFCHCAQNSCFVLAKGDRAGFGSLRILVHHDGEAYFFAFTVRVSIVSLHGIVGVGIKDGCGEAGSFAAALSVGPNKVSGGGIRAGAYGQCLSGADGFISVDGRVGRDVVDGDSHLLASAFAVIVGHSSGYIIMCGAA